VVEGSPADTAGLVEGDVVKSVDSVAVDHRGALREALSGAKAGDEITVVVDHNGTQETVVITLGAQEDRPAPPAAADVAWAGARLVHLENKDGVLVRSVAADGPADAAGIVARDIVTSIDGQEVTDWWQARELIAGHAPGDKVQVVVDRDGVSKTFTVTLGSLDEAAVRPHANGSKAAAVGA
jgi:S1-C subfamily serine protease